MYLFPCCFRCFPGPIGLLQLTITWYKIRHAGEQAHYYPRIETSKQRQVKLHWFRSLCLNSTWSLVAFLKRLVVYEATYAKTATSQKGTLPSSRRCRCILVWRFWTSRSQLIPINHVGIIISGRWWWKSVFRASSSYSALLSATFSSCCDAWSYFHNLCAFLDISADKQTIWKVSNFLRQNLRKKDVSSVVPRMSEGTTFETSASLSFYGANLTHANLFDNKSSCFNFSRTWDHNFSRN